MGRFVLAGLLGLLIGALAGWIAWVSFVPAEPGLAQAGTGVAAECAALAPNANPNAEVPVSDTVDPSEPISSGLILLMLPAGIEPGLIDRYSADIAPAIAASGGRALISRSAGSVSASVGTHSLLPIAIYPSVGGARAALRGPALIRLGEMLAETGQPFVVIIAPQTLEGVGGAG